MQRRRKFFWVDARRPSVPICDPMVGRQNAELVCYCSRAATLLRQRHCKPGFSVSSASPAAGSYDHLEQQLRRCAAGEIDALRAVYRDHPALMMGLALRILGDRRLAEEAV